MRARAGLVAGLAAVALALVPVAPAGAAPRTVQVHPGPQALQHALASAHAGDTLNVHAGTYRVPEGLVVAKPVVIKSAGDGVVTVDGRCKVHYTIQATANNVRLRGLRVVGAAEGFGAYPAEIDFIGVTTGEVSGSVAVDTCKVVGAGAEYGVSVFSSGPVKVLDNETSGFADSGIYIGAITDTGDGTLVVAGNDSFRNVRGIIVEDSFGGSISVTGNRIHHNQRSGGETNAGIYLTNSDRVRLSGNTVATDDEDGIVLDGASDHNRVVDNTISGHTADLRNDGSGNCFTGNTFATSSGDVSHAC
jgi:parallel beta-helix repeat protein